MLLFIGKILLWILLIILIFLLLLLFWPVGYKVSAAKEGEKITLRVRVSWLFGFFRLLYLYPEQTNPSLKLLFFTLGKRKNKSPKVRKKRKQKHKTVRVEPAQTERIEETKQQSLPESEEQILQTDDIEDNGFDLDSEDIPPNAKEPSFINKIQSIVDKVKSILKKVKAFFTNTKDKISGMLQKADHIKDQILFYKELLEKEETKGLLAHVWKRMLKILKRIMPKKIKGWIQFGTGEPDTTGYIMAVYGAIMPILPKRCDLQISADFEEKVLEGKVEIKGRIALIVLVIQAIAILLDKRLYRLLGILKNHSNNK